MILGNEILNWWFAKWGRYNKLAILSGFICLLILYAATLFLKHPVHFFFMIPSILLYVLGLNLVYFGTACFYLFSITKINLIEDSEKKRLTIFKVLLYSTIFLNCLVMLTCLFELGIVSAT